MGPNERSRTVATETKTETGHTAEQDDDMGARSGSWTVVIAPSPGPAADHSVGRCQGITRRSGRGKPPRSPLVIGAAVTDVELVGDLKQCALVLAEHLFLDQLSPALQDRGAGHRPRELERLEVSRYQPSAVLPLPLSERSDHGIHAARQAGAINGFEDR
jgi:hypothetical protein